MQARQFKYHHMYNLDTHVAVCSAMPAEEIDCSLPSCTSNACAAGSALSSMVAKVTSEAGACILTISYLGPVEITDVRSEVTGVKKRHGDPLVSTTTSINEL